MPARHGSRFYGRPWQALTCWHAVARTVGPPSLPGTAARPLPCQVLATRGDGGWYEVGRAMRSETARLGPVGCSTLLLYLVSAGLDQESAESSGQCITTISQQLF